MHLSAKIFAENRPSDIRKRVLRHFRLIHSGLDVSPILAELDAQPDLWDQHPERRTAPGSPHEGMTDIWVRARDHADVQIPGAFREEHRPVFYPAWRRLPAIQPGVRQLMAAFCGVALGNILLTRIRPGQRVLPHVDTGWAPEFYTSKFYVVLRGNADVVNLAGEGDDEEQVVMLRGEVWAFENRRLHSIANNGTTDRISLIVTLRSEDDLLLPEPCRARSIALECPAVVDEAAGHSRPKAQQQPEGQAA